MHQFIRCNVSVTIWVLPSCALPQGKLCAPSSSSTRLLVYLIRASPGPVHENSVSAFSRNPSGRASTFYFSSLFVNPRKSLNVLPLSPYFLALAFPLLLHLLLLLADIPQTSLWTVSLLGFLLRGGGVNLTLSVGARQ